MAKPSTSLLKRRLDIAEIVRKNGEIKVDDLAEMLAVSGVTIRNDLNYLEQQGYLKRSFGGAIYTAQQGAFAASVQEKPSASLDKVLENEIARQLAALIAGRETLFLGEGPILRKVIPFLAERGECCLLFNDLHHIAFAKEFLSGETVLLGGVLSASGKTTEGAPALKALRHYTLDRVLMTVDHIAEDGTLSVRNETQAELLAEAVEKGAQVIAAIPQRPVYGEKRFAIGHLQQMTGVVTPQVVAAEYHTHLQAAGMMNSYTNNECLTWINPALPGAK